MSAECNTSGAFVLLLSLDVKFVNTFQKITKYFNARCSIPLHLDNKFTIDHHRYIITSEI